MSPRVGPGHDDLWREHAACLGLEVNMFFPEKGGPAFDAKRVCAGCPVREDCLLASLHEHEPFGIRGGAGESLRRRLGRMLAQGDRAKLAKAITRHFARLDEMVANGPQSPGTQASYGPGATHGKRSTYARGCRCEPCSEARRKPKAEATG